MSWRRDPQNWIPSVERASANAAAPASWRDSRSGLRLLYDGKVSRLSILDMASKLQIAGLQGSHEAGAPPHFSNPSCMSKFMPRPILRRLMVIERAPWPLSPAVKAAGTRDFKAQVPLCRNAYLRQRSISKTQGGPPIPWSSRTMIRAQRACGEGYRRAQSGARRTPCRRKKPKLGFQRRQMSKGDGSRSRSVGDALAKSHLRMMLALEKHLHTGFADLSFGRGQSKVVGPSERPLHDRRNPLS